MSKNYYLVLGVASNASGEEVKAAFRRRAMELHPDRSGLESGPFQELQEAYSVLSDPERRRDYDAHIGGKKRQRPERARAPRKARRSKAESLRRERAKAEFTDLEDLDVFEATLDTFFNKFWSEFDSITGSRQDADGFLVEVLLSRREAAQGGEVHLRIPAQVECEICQGRGAVGAYACWRCEGAGSLLMDYPIGLEYPAGLRDGAVARISLKRFGLGRSSLTVVFRVNR